MRYLREDSGLSLTELLVVSVLVGVILAASYFMFGAAQTMTNITMARSNANEEAQKAVELMSRELRQSQEDAAWTQIVTNPVGTTDPGPGVFKFMGPSDMQFLSDVDNDGITELVRYYVDAGSLKRTVARQTNANSSPPTYGTAGTPKILVKQIGTTAVGPVFCYHNTVPSTTTDCGTSGRPAKHGFAIVPYVAAPYSVYNYASKTKGIGISMVGIKVVASARSGDKTVEAVNAVLVRMRTTMNLL
jgi:prepilin-type N-terminal cleavage/methylation domain-containing protein